MKWAICILVLLFALSGTVYAKGVELEEGVNQLINGDFEQDNTFSPWVIEDRAPGATGIIELDKDSHDGDFSLKVTATAIDGTDWHFKVKQDNMSCEGGEKHTIKFWARAEKPRVVQVCLQENADPWDGYLWQDVNLTEDWQEFIAEATPALDNERGHWLAFHCGQTLDVWWVDDVRYYRGGPDDEELEEEGPRIAVDPAGKATMTWGKLKNEF